MHYFIVVFFVSRLAQLFSLSYVRFLCYFLTSYIFLSASRFFTPCFPFLIYSILGVFIISIFSFFIFYSNLCLAFLIVPASLYFPNSKREFVIGVNTISGCLTSGEGNEEGGEYVLVEVIASRSRYPSHLLTHQHSFP